MPFLPLFDKNPRLLIRYPWVTWGLIVACVLVFMLEVNVGRRGFVELVYGYGLIPAVFTGAERLPAQLYEVPALLTLVTSLFLHGDFMHLLGNMLFLWVFGDNIEDSMGHLRFLLFYLLCGVVAGLIHLVSDVTSTVPTIGASGAISGVLGAYLILHPRAKVLVPIVFLPLFIPAYILLAVWIAYQVFAATLGGDVGGVAWWAHIGEFLFGMVLVVPMRRRTVPLFDGRPPPRGVSLRRRPQSRAQPAPPPEPPRRRGPWG